MPIAIKPGVAERRSPRTATRLYLAIWIIASLVGALQLAAAVRSSASQALTPEYDRRLRAWSQSYGFASACVPDLLAASTIMLVNPVVGPGERAPVVLSFDPDASPFAYPLYPRIVRAIYDLPAPWLPMSGAIDYVAVWQQAAYRTPAEQAAGAAEERALRARWPTSIVCSFADVQGDRGSIFAVSSRAMGAKQPAPAVRPPVHLATPYGSWRALLGAYLGLASLWCIGGLLLAALAGRALPSGLRAALALPAGCVAVALELATFSLLRLPWSAALILPWLTLAAGMIFRWRAWDYRLSWRGAVTALHGWWSHMGPTERVAGAALLALAALLYLVMPLGLPANDGFGLDYFKARAFWTDGSLLPFYQHASDVFYTQPTHPPLLPLSVAWLYFFVGGVDEHAMLVLWPALLCSLLGCFYALLRDVSTRPLALWETVALALAGVDVTSSTLFGGYADLPLAVYLLGAFGLLRRFPSHQEASWRLLLAAGLLLAGAAWTKEEGLIGALVAPLAAALIAWREQRRPGEHWWYAPLAISAACSLAALPLLALRLSYPAPEVIFHAASLRQVVRSGAASLP